MPEPMLSKLARTINLRDIGGVPVTGGGTVRRGVIYRSATLADMSADDLAALRGLAIRAIIDLRYNRERDRHPTPWQDMGCSDYWCHDHNPAGGGDLSDLLTDPKMTAAASREMMMGVYTRLPYMVLDGLRQLFRAIRDDEGAFLFHCTAGKDRTGIAAALILTALDVPREAILADYLATQTFEILASPGFKTRMTGAPAERVEALRPIFGVEAAYLENTFDTLTKNEGSVQNFIRKQLEVTTADLDTIRKRMVV